MDCYNWLTASFLGLNFLFLILHSTILLTLPWIPFCYFGQESIVAFIALTWDPEQHQVFASLNLPPFILTQNSKSLYQPHHLIAVTNTQLPPPRAYFVLLLKLSFPTRIISQNLVVQLSALIGGGRSDKDVSNSADLQWQTEVCSELVSRNFLRELTSFLWSSFFL